MSDSIKIGNASAVDITTFDSTYLVINWTRQADMTAADYWKASQPDKALSEQFVSSVELGEGQYYGGASGVISFFMLTEDMRQYIYTTVMGSQPVAKVYVTLYHPTDGLQTYLGELVSPFATNRATDYIRFDDNRYWNVQYLFRGGTLAAADYLLMESGDYLLLETGDKIYLEQQD